MYNILIVDDEPLIKANLKMYINNLNKQYTIIGDAANGLEAIDILNKEKVHIVLSDVMMPIMNGVELSAYIHKNFPEITLVMLSNYDDFSYVKSTLKNGARDYILKHTLNEKVLDECLEIIVDNLLDGQKHPTLDGNSNLPQMQHQFILRLIEGNHPDRQKIIDEMAMLKMPIGYQNLIICAIDVDDYIQFSESQPLARIKAIQTSVITLVNQISGEDFTSCINHIEGGRYVLLISFEGTHSAANINQQLMNLLQSIKSNLNRFLSLSVTMSYSYICRDISDISAAYKAVNDSIKQRFVSGKNKIYDHIAKKSGDSEMIWIDANVKQQLISELNYGDKEVLSDLLKQVFNDLKEKQVEYTQCHLLLYDLINIINQNSDSNNIKLNELYDAYDLTSLNLRIFDTLEDIEDFITHLFLILYNRINSGISNDYSNLVKRAITFIKNNFSDPFSLGEAAEHLNVNKSYLSNLFKSEVGIGFNKYLTNARIEQAKSQIIASDSSKGALDLESIAENCGFNSYSYFSTTFKKIVGVSPVQFMKKNQ